MCDDTIMFKVADSSSSVSSSMSGFEDECPICHRFDDCDCSYDFLVNHGDCGCHICSNSSCEEDYSTSCSCSGGEHVNIEKDIILVTSKGGVEVGSSLPTNADQHAEYMENFNYIKNKVDLGKTDFKCINCREKVCIASNNAIDKDTYRVLCSPECKTEYDTHLNNLMKLEKASFSITKKKKPTTTTTKPKKSSTTKKIKNKLVKARRQIAKGAKNTNIQISHKGRGISKTAGSKGVTFHTKKASYTTKISKKKKPVPTGEGSGGALTTPTTTTTPPVVKNGGTTTSNIGDSVISNFILSKTTTLVSNANNINKK